ncbi:CaiF/GrlA family transcriptional regulator [Escherichia coli]|uniref:CaiF/GrlA family transcriptional regulator n=1 Tax=Escherichia coli TaxID=562 RepID=UPI0021571BAE|nr:CaiF/GrlA family transcriptional regulator [Escherichia coli]
MKFTVPGNVCDLKSHPLYVIVAFWGMRTQRLLTSADVSRVFFISQQQARDVLHYICHEASGGIKSERILMFNEHKKKILALKIKDISLGACVQQKYFCRNVMPAVVSELGLKQGSIPDNNIIMLRRWMCTRKRNAPVPLLLISEFVEKND